MSNPGLCPIRAESDFRPLGYHEGDFPEAERAAKETLALPIYPGLTRDQQKYVVDTISAYFMS